MDFGEGAVLTGTFCLGVKLKEKANATLSANAQNAMIVNKSNNFMRILFCWIKIIFRGCVMLFPVRPHIISHILPVTLPMFFSIKFKILLVLLAPV